MRSWAIALLAAAAFAGCVVPSTVHTSATLASGANPITLDGWVLDCTLGNLSRVVNASWGQNCEARASHTPGPKEETFAAVNPTNPLNVVVAAKDLNPQSSASCVWNGLFVTHDGGKTWKDVTIGGTYASRGPTSPFFGYACNTDPDMRFTSDGQLHYGVEMYGLGSGSAWGPGPDNPIYHMTPEGETPGYKILLATSMDGGDTWPLVITFQPDLGMTTDYSRMTIDPTDNAIIEAIGSGAVGENCHVLRSLDDGKTAQIFTQVFTKDGAPCDSGATTAIAVSPTGTVVLMGGEIQTDPNSLVGGSNYYHPIVARSYDDGMTFLDSNDGFSFLPIQGFNESKYRAGSSMELAYDLTKGPDRGTLYITYAAAGLHGNASASNIYVRSSKDDGRTWSDAALVDPDPSGAHQWMPNIAVAGDGSLHVFYMDKQYNTNHTLIDLSHAVSVDGGKTWSTQRVSTLSYDGDLGRHQNGFPFIGDYLGVAAAGNDVWAGFPDASGGQTTVVAAAHVSLAT
ncbi:MAG: sialidase family protein [Thermoplasmatota archaeon]